MVSILSQIETEHEDMIHDCQMDFFGSKLATCSSDKTIRIYSAGTGDHSLLATLEGHDGPVWQISWGHPCYGNLLASCSYDRKVIIWKEKEPNVWSKHHEFDGHESSVNSISWAPKEFGLILASAGADGALCFITSLDGGSSWETKKVKAHSVGCNAVSWSPSTPPSSTGLTVEEAESVKSDSKSKRVVTGGCDNLVKIWKYLDDEDKWIEEHKLEGHSDWVRDVAWAPSIAQTRSCIVSCSQDHRVLIWYKERNSTRWTHQVLNTFDDVVWHVSWSQAGNILSVSCGDSKVSLWKETLTGNWICISDQLNNKSI